MAIYTEDQYRDKYFDPQVTVTRRVEILEADGSTLWEAAGSDPRLIDGNISIDYTRDERRSLDLTLANFDKALIHQPNGFWYDKILRLWRGIEFRDADGKQSHEVSLGKFMIDRTDAPRFPGTLKITARDLTKKCILSQFTDTTSFAAGTLVTDIIAALSANAGIHDKIIPTSTDVLGTDTVFDRGTTRWAAMKQVANAFNYELFFDSNGYLVMRKYIDPTLGPISHEFLTGPDVGNVADWTNTTDDSLLFNHVSVIGSSDNQIPIRADAIDNHPGSPTSVDKIGDRVYPFEDDLISTQAQAQELADSLLAINSLEEWSVDLTALVAPWLEAGEIFQFTDPNQDVGAPDRYLMTSISVPMSLQAMSANGKRVTIVGGEY